MVACTILKMDVNHPLRVVTPTVDGDVLAVLALADAKFTAPRLHELIGAHSESGVRKVLDRLVGQGIVDVEMLGRTSVYALNHQHITAPHIVGLARTRAVLLSRMREAIGAWRPAPAYVALFGSAARGGMRADSDLDLFVVRPDDVGADDPRWSDQLATLRELVARWTGNELRSIELSAAEVAVGLRRRTALLLGVRDDGLCLYGPSNYLTPRSPKG